MKPRIKLTRMHQINGPDYWQADCYFMNHSLRRSHMTKDKALDCMFNAMDAVAYRDWYMAHSMNKSRDMIKELEQYRGHPGLLFAPIWEPEPTPEKQSCFIAIKEYMDKARKYLF